MTIRTRPPTARTGYGAAMAQQAGRGLVLQRCEGCGAVQYPVRELCSVCLSEALSWQRLTSRGRLLAQVELKHSLEPWFSARLPWSLVSVLLPEGVTLLCHAHPALGGQGTQQGRTRENEAHKEAHKEAHNEVQVQVVLDAGDSGVLVALPTSLSHTFRSLEEALNFPENQEGKTRDT